MVLAYLTSLRSSWQGHTYVLHEPGCEKERERNRVPDALRRNTGGFHVHLETCFGWFIFHPSFPSHHLNWKELSLGWRFGDQCWIRIRVEGSYLEQTPQQTGGNQDRTVFLFHGQGNSSRCKPVSFVHPKRGRRSSTPPLTERPTKRIGNGRKRLGRDTDAPE